MTSDTPLQEAASTLNDYWLSACWEAASGYDSIKTIERIYDVTGNGAYVCIHPGCAFARKDSAKLWRHVHTKHGKNTLPPAEFDPSPWMADVDEN